MSAVVSKTDNTVPSLAARGVEVQSSTDVKTAKVAKYALMGIVVTFAAILLLPVILAAASVIVPVGLYKRHVSHKKSAETIEAMAVKRQTAVQEAVGSISITRKNTPPVLFAQILKIQGMLNEEKPGQTHAHMQAVRREIDKALALPVYQGSKSDETQPAIAFLHRAAHALVAQSEGMAEMQAHGAALLKDTEGAALRKDTEGAALLKDTEREVGLTGLVKALEYVVSEGSVFNRDSKAALVFWALFHPQKTFAAFLGNDGDFGKGYNSYENGNANIYLGHYQVGETKMHFYQGPGPTGDRVFEAHLQYLENHGLKQLQHTLEQPGQAGEAARRLMQLEMAKAHLITMTLIATPLDGPAWKGTGPFADEMESIEYFDTLQEFVMDGRAHREMPTNPAEDNGFYFPEEVISDSELETAFDFSKWRFTEFEMDSLHYKAMDSRRQNKARLLAFDTLVSLVVMVNSAEGEEMFFGQACKQDIDRGVVINILSRVFIDGMNGVKIDKTYINQIAGMLHLRPEMVENRAIVMDRFEPLFDMLQILSESPNFFTELKRDFGGFDGTAFVPAQVVASGSPD
ncbi:MAG: hypothetical protein K940chlam2_00833 [Chlamydiae bacterium]|nr:hypothetical protein [Chlamydiota bacterium]